MLILGQELGIDKFIVVKSQSIVVFNELALAALSYGVLCFAVIFIWMGIRTSFSSRFTAQLPKNMFCKW